MNALEAIQAVRTIIINYMALDEQRVWISGERQEIPRDLALFVTLAGNNAQIMSQSQSFDPGTNQTTEYTRMSREIAVEVASRGTEAIERHSEAVAAIASYAAQRDMEEKQYAVYRAGNILDLSDVAGAGVLRRFRIPLIVHYMQTKTVDTEVYENFREVNPVEEA